MKLLPLVIALSVIAATYATLAQEPATPVTQPPQRICGSVLKPAWPLMKDAHGFTIQPGIKPTEDNMGTLEQGYVADAVPGCWVLGWVPHVLKRAPDGVLVHEPVYRKGEEP